MTTCEAVARRLPPVRADLADQLRRASTSIALNIVEGSAEFRPAEKVRFYRIARRSAAECEAVLDVIDRVILQGPPTADARRMVDELVALLTRTAKAVEARQR